MRTASNPTAKLLLAWLGLLALLASLAIACSGGAPEPGVKCGTERWPVKTLSDSDATKVNLTPVAGTVADLRALTAPKSLPANKRVAPTELTTFSVTARVIEFKLEDDKDIHLVIADPGDAAKTLIVEFPDIGCQGAIGSAQAAMMKSARDALIARYGQPREGRFTAISGSATITGVGFFDFLHGQTGVAPNAIELHPVLQFAPAP